MKDLVDILKNTRQHLMNGVSHMIPVVVSGGILFAIAAMLSMNSVQTSASVSSAGLAGFLSNVGSVGLGLMVPVLSAYIAASIADRPGIAPGIIGGQLAVNVGAGFIGGIVTGLVAGIAAYYLKKIPLPKSIQSLKAIFIVPLLATLITGFVIVVVVGNPCAALLKFLEGWLGDMTGSAAILVGAIAGALGVYDNAAWGGLVVLPVTSIATYLLCTVIGVAIYVALCAIFKKDYVEKEEVVEDIDISFE